MAGREESWEAAEDVRTLGGLEVGYLFSWPNADSMVIYYPKMPARILLSESRNEVPYEGKQGGQVFILDRIQEMV
jgi:hypothetical protein